MTSAARVMVGALIGLVLLALVGCLLMGGCGAGIAGGAGNYSVGGSPAPAPGSVAPAPPFTLVVEDDTPYELSVAASAVTATGTTATGGTWTATTYLSGPPANSTLVLFAGTQASLPIGTVPTTITILGTTPFGTTYGPKVLTVGTDFQATDTTVTAHLP